MEEAANASSIAIIDGGRIREQGTPYVLKEKYAKDKLLLMPKEEHRAVFWEKMEQGKKQNFRCIHKRSGNLTPSFLSAREFRKSSIVHFAKLQYTAHIQYPFL